MFLCGIFVFLFCPSFLLFFPFLIYSLKFFRVLLLTCLFSFFSWNYYQFFLFLFNLSLSASHLMFCLIFPSRFFSAFQFLLHFLLSATFSSLLLLAFLFNFLFSSYLVSFSPIFFLFILLSVFSFLPFFS